MLKIIPLLIAVVALSAGAALAQDQGNSAPPQPSGNSAPTTPPAGNGGGNWAQSHPVRAADNHEMHQDVKNGTLTKRQAAKDRRMERRMAAKHGGHLTAKQQKALQRRIQRQQAHDAARKAGK